MFLWSLMIAQFALSAVIVCSARWWPVPWTALFVASPGICLAIWAWGKMGLRKIRVHPTPTGATQLITSGPYRIVRHPMYAGLLWFTAALLLSAFTWWRMLAWVLLTIVIVIKMRHEENAMRFRFERYDHDMQNVPSLVPNFRWITPFARRKRDCPTK